MKVSSVRVMTTRYLPVFSMPVAQRQAKVQHQVLFHLAARLGAVVDAAMAGIDHDHRAQIGRCCAALACAASEPSHGGLGIRNCWPQLGPVFRSQRLHEAGAVDLLQFQHQPRRLAVGGLQHVGIGDLGRARQVEHDSRAARHHQAVAERLDQSAAGVPGAGGQVEN